MNQNLVSIEFSPETLAKFDEAIKTIEDIAAPFIKLSAKDARSKSKMGSKSERFCRQTLVILDQNRGVLPPDFDLAEAQRDLAAFEALGPRLIRLRDVVARGDDTEMALGSDVLAAALDGYSLMQRFSNSESLEALRAEMAERRRGTRKPAPDTAPAGS